MQALLARKLSTHKGSARALIIMTSFECCFGGSKFFHFSNSYCSNVKSVIPKILPKSTTYVKRKFSIGRGTNGTKFKKKINRFIDAQRGQKSPYHFALASLNMSLCQKCPFSQDIVNFHHDIVNYTP